MTEWAIPLIFLLIGSIFTLVGLIRARRADAASGYASPI